MCLARLGTAISGPKCTFLRIASAGTSPASRTKLWREAEYLVLLNPVVGVQSVEEVTDLLVPHPGICGGEGGLIRGLGRTHRDGRCGERGWGHAHSRVARPFASGMFEDRV